MLNFTDEKEQPCAQMHIYAHFYVYLFLKKENRVCVHRCVYTYKAKKKVFQTFVWVCMYNFWSLVAAGKFKIFLRPLYFQGPQVFLELMLCEQKCQSDCKR